MHCLLELWDDLMYLQQGSDWGIRRGVYSKRMCFFFCFFLSYCLLEGEPISKGGFQNFTTTIFQKGMVSMFRICISEGAHHPLPIFIVGAEYVLLAPPPIIAAQMLLKCKFPVERVEKFRFWPTIYSKLLELLGRKPILSMTKVLKLSPWPTRYMLGDSYWLLRAFSVWCSSVVLLLSVVHVAFYAKRKFIRGFTNAFCFIINSVIQFCTNSFSFKRRPVQF